ncbi:MAG: gamma-glutamyl-gamma-aminobutyrate hydrolase family protein [Prevotella sp.]|nr:gamma-glutamyl-gamma-aminobutyrate hydrolase family protein [Prevotella sp.]
MNRFDWKARLAEIHSSFPGTERKPVIGITGNHVDTDCRLSEMYYKSIVAAGGVPVIIPPVADAGVIANTLRQIDGLLLSGGADYNPLYAGEEPLTALHGINAERDLPELLVTRLAYDRQIPMLGICRGIQTLAMALGGRVAQDIDAETGTGGAARVKHSQDARRSEPTHTVKIERDSILHSLYGTESIAVNSFHHQAVADPGKRFKVTATAADGVTEAVESREFKSIMGVQWHPECLEEGIELFRWLVKQAAHYREAHRLHDRVLTLDTHCDTPMFFSRGVKFDSRDPQLLVDMHKMTEGRQDATIMVAYLPQPTMGETFSSKVDFDVSGPTEYADIIFDKIEGIVARNKDYISIARTPADLYEDKRHGRKSIMLGIENGLALGGNIAGVKHFAQRGVVYITLCHNGDNDICDSARGCGTNGGVSRFGEQVIREMNRNGIMVDLSHAAEKSFYDAIDISATPIVCSHSSARALCDHPRNLTDDQMRALARSGGVAQVTLYGGFLKRNGEATVADFMAHLEHAIKVMGIDHVGIGTDFDGDGGVRGLANSAELINFTRMLLARKYSESDIRKIWGGNFLRVMNIVQRSGK